MLFLIFLILMVLTVGALLLNRIDDQLERIARAIEARNERDQA